MAGPAAGTAAARVVAVNRGVVVDGDWAGRLRRTAIDKRPVVGPVEVGTLGVAGDEVADTPDHGGPDQAVYAYAQEDLDHWVEQLGVPLPPGTFGENLTTAGHDVNASLVGERWQLGEPGTGPLLEVAGVRIPCRVFAAWLERQGADATGWVRRFTAAGLPGPYLRVLRTGTVVAGDALEVVHRPTHDLTVRDLFRALTTEPSLLPRLDGVAGLAERYREVARARSAG